MPDTPNKLPGDGFLGWLGRQVGHVAKAVRMDVQAPASAPTKIVYRTDHVEERPHPTQAGVVLRRTTVDEVMVPAPKHNARP